MKSSRLLKKSFDSNTIAENVIRFLITIIMLGMFVSAGISQEIRQLSYEESLRIALQSGYTFKEQENNFKRDYYNLKAQRAALKSNANMTLYLPSFEESIKQEYNYLTDSYDFVSTNFLKYQGQVSITQPIPTGGSFSLNADFYYRDQKFTDQTKQRDYFGKLFLKFSQPFLQPNKLKNDIEKAEMKLNKTRLSYAQRKAFSLSWLAAIFYDQFRIQKQIENNEEMIRQYQEAYKKAEERKNRGQLDETELLVLTVDLENIQSELVKFRSDLQNRAERFKQQIGLVTDKEIFALSDVDFVPFSASLEDAIELGLQNRVELVQARIDMREKQIDYDNIKSQGRLTGQIDITFGYDNTHEDVLSIFEDYDRSKSIVFKFELPILDWGRNKARLEAKQMEMEKNNNYQFHQSRQIVKEISDAYNSLEETLGRLELLHTSREDAQRSYDYTLGEFNNFATSAQELRLARQRLIDTKNRYLNAFVDYQRALVDLNRSTMWDFQNNHSLVTEDEINAIISAVEENENNENN